MNLLLAPELLSRLDALREQQCPPPSRPGAIGQLLEQNLPQLAKPATEHPGEIVLRSAEQVFTTLRLTNTDLFGDHWSPWIFRGQSDPSHRMIAGLWRDTFDHRVLVPPYVIGLVDGALSKTKSLDYVGTVKGERRIRLGEVLRRLCAEHELMQNFVRIANEVELADLSGHPKLTLAHALSDVSKFIAQGPNDLWVEAQHYGLPTRLLDFTGDPLTAVQFALPKQYGVSGNGVIWAIRTDMQFAPVCGSKPTAEFLRVPRGRDKRAAAQRSVLGFVRGGEQAFIENGAYPAFEEAVPTHSQKKFVLELNAIEVNRVWRGLFQERRSFAHLMPDLASSATAALDLYNMGIRPYVAE